MLKQLARRVRRWLTQDIVQALRDQGREIRLQTAVQLLAQQDEPILSFDYRGQSFRFLLPGAGFDAIQSEMALRRSFFEEELLDTIRRRYRLAGAHVVDAGGNIGNHAIYFVKVCRAARCISFEPNPAALALLRRNVELNAVAIEVVDRALSDSEAPLSFDHYPPDNLGGTSFTPDPAGRIAAMTLDSLGLERLDFIKIDVEGMADQALAGAAETLTRHRPPILIELLPEEQDAAHARLARLGYRRVESFGYYNYLYEAG